jgi:hypothetical protein
MLLQVMLYKPDRDIHRFQYFNYTCYKSSVRFSKLKDDEWTWPSHNGLPSRQEW